MTKLDDLRDFVRSKKNKKENNNSIKENFVEKEKFSLEVAGSDATSNPLASFGDSETAPDLIEQLHSNPRARALRGEGATYWDRN